MNKRGFGAWHAVGMLLGLSGTAHAASDKVEIAPVPGWVRPVAPPGDDGKSTGAAARMLLQDEQVRFEHGRQTSFSETILRIQTPEGLRAGNLSIPWRPDTDTLTVHKLLIRRGTTTIDVLATGQTFTVLRRETNLESAMLDGVLTASIQPEGLQVGDVIDFAASMSRADPVLQDHVEDVAAAWNALPIMRAHLRMQWPSTMPLRLRQTAALPALKMVRAGDTTSVELSLENIEPLNLPKGAPPRFRLGRLVETTDYGDWARLGALMAPLYAKASALPADGPLQAEVARIHALSPDPKIRAEAALALVQERVRYVALMMGQGGYVPTDAATTWSRRFGDCKAKTVLLIGLLRALDIDAEPVAVNAISGDGIDQRLPMIALFNHVLVRLAIAGKVYWLDGTRTGDRSLDRLETPNYGWGLPLVAQRAALVQIVPPPLDRPSEVATIRVDARDGLSLPAKVHAEVLYRGDAATGINLTLANLTADARDRALREFFKGRYDTFDVTTTRADYDPATGQETVAMDGTTKMDWSHGSYETDGSALGWHADFARLEGPDRDAPYAVPFPLYTTSTETVLLPPGFENFTKAENAEVDQTIGGVAYRRYATIKDGVFTVATSQRSVAPEFASSEAPRAEKALRDMADAALRIATPREYRWTDKELDVALAATPTSALAFAQRGEALRQHDRPDEAIADFSRALALEPRNAAILTARGEAYGMKHDLIAARRDFDGALAIAQRDLGALAGRAQVSFEEGDREAALAELTAALQIAPDDPRLLLIRARQNQKVEKNDEALADVDAVLRQQPTNPAALFLRAALLHQLGRDDAALPIADEVVRLSPKLVDVYLLRANIYIALGRREQIGKQAEAVAAAVPDDAYAHVVAAKLYAVADRPQDNASELDRALAIKPEAYIYYNRYEARARQDVTGRRSDLDAALRMDATFAPAIMAKAALLEEAGDLRGAVALWTNLLISQPKNVTALARRGAAYTRLGEEAAAQADFSAAQKNAHGPVELNQICWQLATTGRALEQALAACDQALAANRDAPVVLDSRGFVLMRLGRYDEAITAYDSALAKRPNQSGSLFGRGLAFAHKGATVKAETDFAAALAADPKVEQTFADYGVTRPATPAVPTAARIPPLAPARRAE